MDDDRDHEYEKINKPSEDTIDVASTSFGNMDKLSNQEIFMLFKESKDAKVSDIVQYYDRLIGLSAVQEHSRSNELTIYKRIKTVYETAVKLRGEKRTKYLCEEFQRPRRSSEFISDILKDSPRKRKLREQLHKETEQNKQLKKQLNDSFEVIAEMDNEIEYLSTNYEKTIYRLANIEGQYGRAVENLFSSNALNEQEKMELSKQLTELEFKYQEISEELKTVNESTKTEKVRNLNKKVKTREATIQKGKYKLQKSRKELESKTKELADANKEIQALKKERQQLSNKLRYSDEKKDEYKEELKNMRGRMELEKTELQLHQKEIELKEKELEYIESVLEDQSIITFSDGKYTDDVHQTIMELLSMNVSVNKVNDVIRVVLKRLTGKEVDRLPSKGLRTQMLIEARHIADMQIGEAMLKDVDLTMVLGNTLHGDGTTKYHRHYQGFQLTTTDGQSLSTGLLETVSQDADTILLCWKDRVTEIANAICGQNNSMDSLTETIDKLLSSVKNTMSDQCATNGVFNQLMQSLRNEVLPRAIDNWETLNDKERSDLSQMGHFFCKVHPLITFAEEANKALLRFESACTQGKSKYALPTSGESGAVRLIRTACQAFQKRGHQAAGVSEDFVAYLSELGVPLRLIQLEGNRFNVIFFNGGAVYFHHNHFKDFINSKPSANRLLMAVLEDSNNEVFLAGARALGIISKLITGPYFRLVGDTDSVLDLNPHLHTLQEALQTLSLDASSLMKGQAVFDTNVVPIQADEMFDKLLQEKHEEFDVLTQQALELLCSAILLTLERQCEDQLPGGKYFLPSESLQLQASNVPTSI